MPSAVRASEPVASGPRKSAIVAKYILDNCRCRVRQALGRVNSSIGSTHSGKSLAESLDYIDRVYRDYIFYAGLSPGQIVGARVLELGPGDNFGVALRFLAAGATEVVALDRFATDRDSEHAAMIYRAMRSRMRGVEAERFDAVIDLTSGIRLKSHRLRVIEGVATEDADKVLNPESYSLIVSRSVLEEIHEIDRAFVAMDRLLATGGRMIHKIDLSDYGIFSRHGMHPLEFLTIPQTVYTLMTRYSGHPNRRRIDYYRTKMRELGYFAGVLVTGVAGETGELVPHKASIEEGIDYTDRSLALVRDIRPRLARQFRQLPAADLLVSGIFLVARKAE